MKSTVCLIALALVWMMASPVTAEDEFEASTYKDKHGHALPYRLLQPENYDKTVKYPILLFLHGYGERGTDNKAQLKNCVKEFLKPAMRKKYPCFVLAPQSPGTWIGIPDFKKPMPANAGPSESLLLAVETLEALIKEYSIDTNRLYLAGGSNGGYGVWYLLEHDPHRWAAAVPMCGGGDPAEIHVAKNNAIWAFHGEEDPTVPVERSREMIAALKAAGGKPKFTEYPKVKHMESAIRAFKDKELFAWMFEQKN